MNIENIPTLENVPLVNNISIDSNVNDISIDSNAISSMFERATQEAAAQYTKINPRFVINTDGIIHINYENIHTQKEQPDNLEEWMELLK